jgi:hypothetical protein
MSNLTARQRAMLTDPDSRMDAYYYGFDRTGVPEVDAILSALAWAGKCLHSTADWDDPEYNLGCGPFDAGQSYIEVIQAAANEAAERIRALHPREGNTTELPQKENAYRFRGSEVDVIAELPKGAADHVRRGYGVTVTVEWHEPTEP